MSVGSQGRQRFSFYGFGFGQFVSVSVVVRGWQVFEMVLVVMFIVALPESQKRSIMGVSVYIRSWRIFKSMPNKACSGRRGVCAFYKQFAGFEFFSTSQAFVSPAPPPLTQTVGHLAIRNVKNG